MNAEPSAAPSADPVFGHPDYLLVQQFLSVLGTNFRLYDPSGTLVLFCRQKAFKLREDIRVYADEAMTRELLTIKARQIVDFSAAYDVVDARQGAKVGALKRRGWASMVRDAWIVMDADDVEIGQIAEDSTVLALVRRFVLAILPQAFTVTIDGRPAAHFQQYFNPFLKKMKLDFAVGEGLGLDRRLGLAAAILLAAVEGRQG